MTSIFSLIDPVSGFCRSMMIVGDPVCYTNFRGNTVSSVERHNSFFQKLGQPVLLKSSPTTPHPTIISSVI